MRCLKDLKMKRFAVTMLFAAALVFAGGQNNPANAAQNFSFDNYNFINLTTGTVYEAVVDSNIDFLALRSGPDVSYRLILKIPPGARIKVTINTGASYSELGIYPYNNNFVRVNYRGTEGYSNKKYITFLRKIGDLP